MNNTNKSTWDLDKFDEPNPGPSGSGREKQHIERWLELRKQVYALAKENSWSAVEVCKKADMKNSTFSQWCTGKYIGRIDNTNEKIKLWLDAETRNANSVFQPIAKPFVKTSLSIKITNALQYAQALQDISVIVCDAGSGKTETCKQYQLNNPNTFIAHMSPHSQTAHGMLLVLASVLGVHQNNPGKMVEPIGKILSNDNKGGRLLIIEEGQNLKDEAINQLRHFSDNYKVGIALVGNREVYDRFQQKGDGPSHAQMRSRIGMRVSDPKPSNDDLNRIINAWGVTDSDMVKFLFGVGQKEGHIRQMVKTLSLAEMLAHGRKEALEVRHLNAAWKQRNLEGVS